MVMDRRRPRSRTTFIWTIVSHSHNSHRHTLHGCFPHPAEHDCFPCSRFLDARQVTGVERAGVLGWLENGGEGEALAKKQFWDREREQKQRDFEQFRKLQALSNRKLQKQIAKREKDLAEGAGESGGAVAEDGAGVAAATAAAAPAAADSALAAAGPAPPGERYVTTVAGETEPELLRPPPAATEPRTRAPTGCLWTCRGTRPAWTPRRRRWRR